MKERRIPRDSWRIVETILRRYPVKKKEYEEYMMEIMASSGDRVIGVPEEESNKPQSVTEAKALKMTSSYFERLKKEIESVEFVYGRLKPEEQKVIRMRYWKQGIKRPVPYLDIQDTCYSERQMKRIVSRTIMQIGRYLGEIR